jgi:LysM repeat protein
MKILQIFGAVVAVHLLAFIFIFASPGCQGSPRNVPTPDATVPTASAPSSSPLSYSSGAAEPVGGAPADLGTAPIYTPGRAAPTRPGSPNAVAITPAKPAVEDVAPVSTYTVQKGDSLWSIAKRNHLTVAELAKANSLGASTPLQPGKKLIIPGKPGAAAQPKDLGTAPAAAEKPAAPAPGSHEAVKHTVTAGESLGTIARKYQVTVGELAAANNITDPAKIRVGQTLVLPGFKAVGAKPVSKPTAPAAAAGTPVAEKPAAETAPANVAPHFEIKAPPPGQDLDAGLKDSAATDVPTIKVEEPKPEEPPKK